MLETYVELQEIPVLRVRADMNGKGPSAAMELLESKLPTLKGRRFYGCFRERTEGEEYYACVARIDTDDPGKMRLETGSMPGGRYARRKVLDWEEKIRDGQLPRMYHEMVQAHGHEIDVDRPSLEYYRSQAELQLFLPVQSIPHALR